MIVFAIEIGNKMSIDNLFTKSQLKKLRENSGENNFSFKNHLPVAYIHIRKLGYSFLITEIDPLHKSLVYGLQDTGDMPYIDIIDLDEWQKKAEAVGDFLDNKLDFKANVNLAVYARAAADMNLLDVRACVPLFKEKMQRYSTGKNLDKEQDLRNLKFKLSWV